MRRPSASGRRSAASARSANSSRRRHLLVVEVEQAEQRTTDRAVEQGVAFGCGERDAAGGEVLVQQREIRVVAAVEDPDAVPGCAGGEVLADESDDGPHLVVGIGGVDDLGRRDPGIGLDCLVRSSAKGR